MTNSTHLKYSPSNVQNYNITTLVTEIEIKVTMEKEKVGVVEEMSDIVTVDKGEKVTMVKSQIIVIMNSTTPIIFKEKFYTVLGTHLRK